MRGLSAENGRRALVAQARQSARLRELGAHLKQNGVGQLSDESGSLGARK